MKKKVINEKMKIAVLIRNFRRNAGGAERYCVELSERLSEYHDVHIFCQSNEKTTLPIKFHRISKYFDKPRFLNQILFSYLTNRAISMEKFDVVHSHELVAHADVFIIHLLCFKSILLNLIGFTINFRFLTFNIELIFINLGPTNTNNVFSIFFAIVIIRF